VATTDLILLEKAFAQTKVEQAPDLSDDDFFEIFVAQNLLKQEALSFGELQSGLLGAGGDGGIDAAYIFIDGILLREDTESSDFKKKPKFRVFVIQAKNQKKFNETPIDKFISSAENLLDLSKELDEFSSLYNGQVISTFRKFRETFLQLASKHPEIEFKYFYASKGDVGSIHDNTKTRVKELETTIKRHFSEAPFDFEFIGAAELLAYARKRPPAALALPFSEILSATEGGYVALARLRDYNRFLRDENGERYGHIFDENVRAYQGNVEVNKAIRNTLRNPQGEDFWQLNNGITILSEKASTAGKNLQITDPQVINGLQTSTEVLAYFDDGDHIGDNRQILVKVVESGSSGTRDRVIEATNKQTGVQSAQLRATDPIQRNIEDMLQSYNFYYDRRKNYYKNEGRPRDSIIGIAELAQSIMSVLLQRPNDARARPSNIIRDDSDYSSLFSDSYDLKFFVVCAALKKKVDSWMKLNSGLEAADRNNVVFHTLMRLAMRVTGELSPNSTKISEIDYSNLTNADIKAAFGDVLPIYQSLGGDAPTAKGRLFKDRIKALPL
jgi:hypothetical protein